MIDRWRRVLVIGVGNELRGDDGVGIAAARRVREDPRGIEIDVEEEQNDPSGVVERMRARDAVVLVDAVAAPDPGSIRRLDASHRPLPRVPRSSSSTHAVAVRDAIELARALGSLPLHVIVYAVAGRRFDAGAELSPEVAAAVPEVAEQALAEALRLGRRKPPKGQ